MASMTDEPVPRIRRSFDRRFGTFWPVNGQTGGRRFPRLPLSGSVRFGESARWRRLPVNRGMSPPGSWC
jgi:hypothetical protein